MMQQSCSRIQIYIKFNILFIMIPIKEHNDLIEKLLAQIKLKENQTKELNRQIHQINQIQPNSLQLHQNNKLQEKEQKVNSLNKELKNKINDLELENKNLRSQIKRLNYEMEIKSSKELKEKEHIKEVMKKNYDRKASTLQDHQMGALISHYQCELEKKSTFITTLQKEIKMQSIKSGRDEENASENSKMICTSNDNLTQTIKGIGLVEHQHEVAKCKNETQKWQRLFEEKEKQYKDMAKRYSQLTNDYYKIINEYGCEGPKATNSNFAKKNNLSNNHLNVENVIMKINDSNNNKNRQKALQNLLYEMAGSESEADSSDLSFSFHKNLKHIQTNSNWQPVKELTQTLMNKDTQMQLIGNEECNSQKLNEILDILELKDANEIVPFLAKLQAKTNDCEGNDNICRYIQSMLYRFGMGKVSRTEVIKSLEDLEVKLNQHVESAEILDEICIQVGAKKDRARAKIQELKAVQDQFFKNMKSIKYVQQLPRTNKVIEFIQFFELDSNDLELPEQLKNIYQQLKYVDKFVKQANSILEIENLKGLDATLELVLRYLEKTTTAMALVNQRDRSKK